MKIGEHIHWFVTDRCNLNCSYCFREHFANDESKGRIEKLASILADNNVKKVTIGGGEPLLVKSLDSALKIFKDAGIYTSIHTNALLLDKKRIKELKSIANEIAIPIDSMNRETQKDLKNFDYLPVFEEVFENLQKTKLELGYHTVATYLNIDEIEKIYEWLEKSRFKFWRIYEFNSPLLDTRTHDFKKFDRINRLQGPLNLDTGLTGSLDAKFLKKEEEMQKYNDERIQFCGLHDTNTPYAFLDNSGDISFYAYFSNNRKLVGNILKEDFAEVKQKLKEAENLGTSFDEESYKEHMFNRPVWARIYDGNYTFEELGEIHPPYDALVIYFLELYQKREKRQIWAERKK